MASKSGDNSGQAGRPDPAAPIRLLIVDDSAFVRRTLRSVIEPVPDIVIVGEAADGREALEKVAALSPDVLTLDLQMPGLDGLTTLRALKDVRPALPVLVVASAGSTGGAAVFEALSIGAFDFIDKSSCTPMDLHLLGPQIVGKIRAALKARGHRPPKDVEKTPGPGSSGLPRNAQIVCVGASTGGPPAIQHLLEALPVSFRIPVVIVQHMPAGFTTAFAERLNRCTPLEVKEAEESDEIRAGRVLVAPAGRHLCFERGSGRSVAHLELDQSDSAHVPSVDRLFSSAAGAFGADVIAVILTGMGCDGLEGARKLVESGAFLMAESEESCAVYGMPRAVVEAGLTRAVWPLSELARRLAAAG